MDLKMITFRLLLLAVSLTFLPGCKKYPENNLWFRSPENTFTKGKHKLTSFTVNGEDSIPRLSSAWGFDVTEKTFFLFKEYHDRGWWTVSGDLFGSFVFEGDKEINFLLSPVEVAAFPGPAQPVYNALNSRGMSDGKTDGRWDIIKCTKKYTLKLRRKVSGKTYEVQFN
jgi:hypothetical protein